jgi:hypothetical protein
MINSARVSKDAAPRPHGSRRPAVANLRRAPHHEETGFHSYLPPAAVRMRAISALERIVDRLNAGVRPSYGDGYELE